MVNVDSSFGQHLLNISATQSIPQVSFHCHDDDQRREVLACERSIGDHQVTPRFATQPGNVRYIPVRLGCRPYGRRPAHHATINWKKRHDYLRICPSLVCFTVISFSLCLLILLTSTRLRITLPLSKNGRLIHLPIPLLTKLLPPINQIHSLTANSNSHSLGDSSSIEPIVESIQKIAPLVEAILGENE